MGKIEESRPQNKTKMVQAELLPFEDCLEGHPIITPSIFVKIYFLTSNFGPILMYVQEMAIMP